MNKSTYLMITRHNEDMMKTLAIILNIFKLILLIKIICKNWSGNH